MLSRLKPGLFPKDLSMLSILKACKPRSFLRRTRDASIPGPTTPVVRLS